MCERLTCRQPAVAQAAADRRQHPVRAGAVRAARIRLRASSPGAGVFQEYQRVHGGSRRGRTVPRQPRGAGHGRGLGAPDGAAPDRAAPRLTRPCAVVIFSAPVLSTTEPGARAAPHARASSRARGGVVPAQLRGARGRREVFLRRSRGDDMTSNRRAGCDPTCAAAGRRNEDVRSRSLFAVGDASAAGPPRGVAASRERPGVLGRRLGCDRAGMAGRGGAAAGLPLIVDPRRLG